MKLILIRHGQSQWNLENRFTGRKDVDLTEQGRKEAYHAGMLIKDIPIDVAFTSCLVRAEHTLTIIQDVCGLQDIPVIKNAALNERGYGNLEGMDKAEAAKLFGDDQVHIWRRSYDIPPPGGESLKDTYNRTVPYFLNTIMLVLQEGKNVLIVAHGNSLRSLVMYLEKLSPEEILNREIGTGIPLQYEL